MFIGTTICTYTQIWRHMSRIRICVYVFFSFVCWQVVLINLPLKMKLEMGSQAQATQTPRLKSPLKGAHDPPFWQ